MSIHEQSAHIIFWSHQDYNDRVRLAPAPAKKGAAHWDLIVTLQCHLGANKSLSLCYKMCCVLLFF